ncbi:MAG: 2-hydroxyacyl-CoA dehydratase [Thermodesulfobacteriota bacterium]
MDHRPGWVCSYTPRELILAAGFASQRLLTGVDQEPDVPAESYLPPIFCPYVRRLCSLCLQSKGPG